MDVSDRRMQVQLTPEAKIATDFLFIGAIFAVVGFVNALSAAPRFRRAALCRWKAAQNAAAGTRPPE